MTVPTSTPVTLAIGILGVGPIAHQEMGEPVGIIEIWQREVTKTPRPLVAGFVIAGHRVSLVRLLYPKRMQC
jgi:hypothetical protein